MSSADNMIQQIQNPPKPVSRSSLITACSMAGAKIALGVAHLDECPAQPYIPIYLIVFGVFSILGCYITALPWTRQNSEECTALDGILLVVRNLSNIFMPFWFIAGSHWIYSIYVPSYIPGSVLYCNRVLYLFAFWTTTVIYITFALGLVFYCISFLCVFFCACLWSSTMEDVEDV
ncbi:transmembrane protein 272-like [Synchiropus splendidus]|uniref:transmembrane protein 272-like n=1 Tax=Synchiropus splendidus TaxID=270530 RepID=UPI00237E7CE7|nr:transmembrane protein 272-like [Synchiropus splendidus]